MDDDDSGSGSTFIWGVVFGLLGSIAINTGNNLQSLGIRQLEEKQLKHKGNKALRDRQDADDGGEVELNACSSRTWVTGTTIFLTGSLLNFASYGLAAQSVLACLEAIQFVTNIAFGKFMLQKRITKRMYVGTAMIVSGTVMAVLFGSKCEYKGSAKSLIALYENPVYIAYLVFILVGGIMVQMLHLHHQQLLDHGRPTPNTHIILPVTYAVFSALFGTQSVVQAKCLAELLEAMQNDGEPIFQHWFTYVSLVVWIAFVSVWLYRLNEALGKYDPLFIIPLLQANFIFFAIVSGGIYFKEFNVFTPGMWAGFIIGVLIIFYGLFLLRPEEVIVPIANDSEELPNTAYSPSKQEAIFGSKEDEETGNAEAAPVSPECLSSTRTTSSQGAEGALKTPRDGENASPPPQSHTRRPPNGSFVVKVASITQQSLPTTYNTPRQHRISDPRPTPEGHRAPNLRH